MNTAEWDVALLRELRELGLNEHSYRAICLLPLVEVAWADDVVQPRERTTILEIAHGHELLTGKAREVVEGWLTHRPTPEQFKRGRKLLVKLAFRKRGMGAPLPKRAVESVVEFCELVAESAGGLFDTYWTVSAAERKAIREIADHLARLSRKEDPHLGIVGRTLDPEWQEVVDELASIQTDEVDRS